MQTKGLTDEWCLGRKRQEEPGTVFSLNRQTVLMLDIFVVTLQQKLNMIDLLTWKRKPRLKSCRWPFHFHHLYPSLTHSQAYHCTCTHGITGKQGWLAGSTVLIRSRGDSGVNSYQEPTPYSLQLLFFGSHFEKQGPFIFLSNLICPSVAHCWANGASVLGDPQRGGCLWVKITGKDPRHQDKPMFLVWHGSELLWAERSTFHVGMSRHSQAPGTREKNETDLIFARTNQSRWNAGRAPSHPSFAEFIVFFP